MDESKTPAGGKIYTVGNIGAGAKVAVGEHNQIIEALSTLPDSQALSRQFDQLLKEIAAHPEFDDDRREMAQTKVQNVAIGLAEAEANPGKLRRALLEVKEWAGAGALWLCNAVGTIVKSEAAQKTLATVTEAGTKAVISSFTGGA